MISQLVHWLYGMANLRTEIKTVGGKNYLQFIDKDSQRYHLGSAEDAGSWLIALIFWNQQLESEFQEQKYRIFTEFIEKMSINTKVEKSDLTKQISSVAWYFNLKQVPVKLRLKLPMAEPFATFDVNLRKEQWTDFGLEVQKRLKDVYWKRKRFERKQSGQRRMQTDVQEKVRRRNIEAFRCVREISEFPSEKRKQILSAIYECRQATGKPVERKYVVEQMWLRHGTGITYTERLIGQLVNLGYIIEPEKDYLDVS
jgi:hypothetical protein